MDKQTKVSDFSIMGKLGEGAFSSVYKVLRKSDRKTYAMKQVKMNKLTEREKINAVNEVRILASLNDPNIIGYKEAFYDEYTRCLCIVQEFAQGGDMMSQIGSCLKKKQNFPEDQIWSWFIQLIQGLKQLHSMNIMHRDIKSANIFLTTNQQGAKLGDLNVSKVTKQNHLAYTQTGTPYYAAPEIWKDSPYNNKCDIWSLGCVIFEIASLKPPFRAQNMEGLYKKIQKGVYERIPQRYSEELYNIISMCLITNPEKRPNSEQLLSHPFITKRMNLVKNILPQEQQSQQSQLQAQQLMNTIRLPRNLKQLKDRLPKSTYESQVESVVVQRNSSFRRSPLRSRSIEDKNSNKPPSSSKPELGNKKRALQPINPNVISPQGPLQPQSQAQKQINYLSRNRAGSLHTHNKGKLQDLQAQQQYQNQNRQLQVSPSGRGLRYVANKENVLLPNLPLRSSSNHNIKGEHSRSPLMNNNKKLKVVQYSNRIRGSQKSIQPNQQYYNMDVNKNNNNNSSNGNSNENKNIYLR